MSTQAVRSLPSLLSFSALVALTISMQSHCLMNLELTLWEVALLTSRCYTVARCIILVVALLVLDNCLKVFCSARQLPQAVVSHCKRLKQCETTASGSCLALQKTFWQLSRTAKDFSRTAKDFKTPVLQLFSLQWSIEPINNAS